VLGLERNAGEHLDGRQTILGQLGAQILASQLDHRGRREGLGGGAVVAGLEQGALPRGVPRPQGDDGLGTVAGIATHLHAAMLDEVAGAAGLALTEEPGARRQFALHRNGSQALQGGFGKPLEELGRPEDGTTFLHGPLQSRPEP